jgi:hypothetical protein
VRKNPTDLFPEELGQTRRGITVTTHAEQANKHDEKQDDVGCRQGNQDESVTQRLVPTTGEQGIQGLQ